MIELKTKITKEDVDSKAGAISNDVGAIYRSDIDSVQSIFGQKCSEQGRSWEGVWFEVTVTLQLTLYQLAPNSLQNPFL